MLVILSIIVICVCSNTSYALVPFGYQEYIHVTAEIDGVDTFEIMGNQWRWLHHEWYLPEIHTVKDGGVAFPTVVNGQSFLSTWDVAPGWYFEDTYSHYNEVAGLLSVEDVFGGNLELYLDVIQARGSVTLDENPSSNNNYKFSVLLDDGEHGAESIYEFKIWGYDSNLNSTNAVPEPSSIFLLGSGILGLALKKRLKGRK